MAGLRWLLQLAVVAPVVAHGQAVPRAAHDLGHGRPLTGADIATDSTTPHALELVGWVTRRVIRTGELLRPPAISPPPLVRAGDPVSVRLATAGITVSRKGTALMTGILGDRVRVRLDGQQVLSAVVAGPSMVRLP